MQRFENKYDLLNAAYRDASLKKGAVLLLQYLVYKSNIRQCFPSVDTIARALNVCKRTVQYNMRKLEQAGYIIRESRWYNHQQLTNQYVFNFGVIEDNADACADSSAFREALKEFAGERQQSVKKIEIISRIYNRDLSAREKLLLIYLYHKANNQGIAYGMPSTFMAAIGVKEHTLNMLLRKLREKGLILIKRGRKHGRVFLIIHLAAIFDPENETQREAPVNLNINKQSHIRIHGSFRQAFLKVKCAVQTVFRRIRAKLRI